MSSVLDAPLHCPAGLLQIYHLIICCIGWSMLPNLSALLPYNWRHKSFKDENFRGWHPHDGGSSFAPPAMDRILAVQSNCFIAWASRS